MVRKFEVSKSFNPFKLLLYMEFHIILYMMHLLQTEKTFPVIRMSHFAINYFHSIVRYQNPCPASLPYNVPEGIKRILAYSATKKLSATVSQLYEMYNYFGSKAIILSNLTAILICFIFYEFSTV